MARDSSVPQATVLLSGGIDSAAVLALLKSQGMQVRCLFVDYGQPAAEQELAASSSIASLPSPMVVCHNIWIESSRK